MASKNKLKNIQVRIDAKLKERAERVFEAVGLDTPTAIRVFFAKVADVGGIPFDLGGEHYSEEQLRRIDAAVEESKKPGNLIGPFHSVDKLIKALRS
ncbi:MAG: type II toxin-antitoxin system RelB/DinJ family antitoxin [Candidatus Peribacteraceae bacterium]|nr:type II toxin-antitoxin system RelB/DinJ family antitoxin [Candidatus Peribacteraceae bacterium]